MIILKSQMIIDQWFLFFLLLLAAPAPVVYTWQQIQVGGSLEMVSNGKNQPPVDNSISDSTGQYDLRFVLWRQFCSENGIPVDTLPSQLNDDQKDKWEKMKAKRLR